MTNQTDNLLRSWFTRQYIRFTGFDETGEPKFALTAYGRAKLRGKSKFKPARLAHTFGIEAQMEEWMR